MDARDQTVGVLERAAPAIARRERWPAGLLPRVQLALAGADPAGLNMLATRADWYAAAQEALFDVARTQADADKLSTLLELASGGAGAFAVEQAGVRGQAQDALEDVASDLSAVADTAGRVATSPATWIGLGALGLGAAYLLTRR